MRIDNKTDILIIGLGLMGGSYAMGLTKRGYKVDAIDNDKDVIKYALDKHYINKGSHKVDKELVSSADLIIFGLYPDTMVEWIKENQDLFKSGAIITDVTGVKGCIVEKVQDILRSDVEYISAHPMAGREKLSIYNSDDSIFTGANYIVVPTSKNTQDGIETSEELARILGFFKTVEVSAQEHDEIIGFVSQLTHCIAISLMNCNHNEKLEDFTGDSFRDLTRIARIDEKLWSKLFMLNKDALLHQMKLFTIQFSHLERMLMEDDVEGIKEMMIKSSKRRELFNKGNLEE